MKSYDNHTPTPSTEQSPKSGGMGDPQLAEEMAYLEKPYMDVATSYEDTFSRHAHQAYDDAMSDDSKYGDILGEAQGDTLPLDMVLAGMSPGEEEAYLREHDSEVQQRFAELLHDNLLENADQVSKGAMRRWYRDKVGKDRARANWGRPASSGLPSLGKRS